MSGLTESIERFLKDLFDESDEYIEIGRNDLAERFECAPSQINYVLSTRFTPYKGYAIESRRGGSGYIRIIKLRTQSKSETKELYDKVIGDSLTKDKARSVIESLYEKQMVTKKEAQLMIYATDDNSLKNLDYNLRNTVRSDLLKNMMLVYFR